MLHGLYLVMHGGIVQTECFLMQIMNQGSYIIAILSFSERVKLKQISLGLKLHV